MPKAMPNSLMTKASETTFFFKRVLKNPRQLGAIVPSSARLGRLMAKHLDWECGRPVVELGGGTGALTRSLLAAGILPQQLYVVELDHELAAYLKRHFPEVNIIHGSASDLEHILPPEIIGQVKTVVSGLPMINFPEHLRHAIVNSTFNIMDPDGELIQYSYSPRASLRASHYGLSQEKVGQVLRNLPPAIVWRYSKTK